MPDLQPFLDLSKAKKLFPLEQNRVVVACSGGADSLFLLYLLWSCREQLNLDLSVLTCDHGLRLESAHEAHDVRQRAWTLGLPCQLHELDVSRNQRSDESIEMAARRLRREAYLNVAQDFNADSVALGHHLDDQAETVLLKLARGTGPRGAGGMEWVSTLSDDVKLIRPLLGFRRKEIETQLQIWGVKPVEDPSNREDLFLRNRVRHEILPLFVERINPQTVRNISAFAERQRKLEAWVSHEAQERGRACLIDDTLALEPWRFLPEVLQERILMGWLQQVGSDVGTVGQAALSQIIQDLNRKVPHSRRWKVGGLKIRVDQEVLSVDNKFDLPMEKRFSWPGDILWEPLQRPLHVSMTNQIDLQASQATDFKKTLTAFMKKPGKNQFLSLRAPLPGDRYQPLGMSGRSKLSDLFINQHLPAKIRHVWPVVVCGNEIVWVPGFRVADQWRADEKDCLKLEFT